MMTRDRMHFRTGFGIAAGIFGALWATPLVIGIVQFLQGRHDEWRSLLLVGVPLFGGPAAFMLLARAGTTLDKRRRRATRWWGLWLGLLNLRFLWRNRPLDDFDLVVFHSEVRTGKNNSTWLVYPVRLVHDTQGAMLDLCVCDTYRGARREAERAAKFLELPLQDNVRGPSPRREAGTLDQPLADRLHAPVQPVPPETTTVARRVDGDAAVFEIAPPGSGWGMAMLVAVLFVILFELSVERSAARDVRASAAAVAGGLAIATLLRTHFASRRQRLIVSPGGLRVERRSWIWRSSARIPAGELEELEVCASKVGRGGRVVSARSDRAIIEFGVDLEEAELCWIRDEILSRLHR